MKPHKHHSFSHDQHASQILRDLHWAITSPALISPSPEASGIGVDLDPALIDVEELTEFLEPYSRFRVGEYFEGLILYWLQQVLRLKIIAQHQQLFVENQTVGEIDFLFEDEAGDLNHWETAVKFYLSYPKENQTGSHFIGPNAKDTFEKKRRRLFEHQLPLSETHFPAVKSRMAYIKGIIFYHSHHTPPTQLPELLSPTHLKGIWVYQSELDWLEQEFGEAVYQIREKPDWLSPLVCDVEDEKLLTFANLKKVLAAHFQKRDRPLMISALKQNQNDCREIERLFVVSDMWPEQA